MYQTDRPRLCEKCGSPLCGYCGKCIDETHPKRADGSIVEFGSSCPFQVAKETIHCPNCGSIYVWDFELGDFTVQANGDVECHVCHHKLGSIIKTPNVPKHIDPSCPFCIQLQQ